MPYVLPTLAWVRCSKFPIRHYDKLQFRDTWSTQNGREADQLIGLEKKRVDDSEWAFDVGKRVAIPLTSMDGRVEFRLDISRAQIKLTKATFQNRVRQVVILMRLDLDGPPHRNPDGVEIPCPHLHIYREGYGDKWAWPAPMDRYANPSDMMASLDAFMRDCNIIEPPVFQLGLF